MSLGLINLFHLILLFLFLFGIFVVWPNRRFRLLSLFLVIQVLQITFNYFEQLSPGWANIDLAALLGFGVGPALYLWVRQVVYRQRSLALSDLNHLLPFLLGLATTPWPQFMDLLSSWVKILYLVIAIFMIQRYHLAASMMRADAPSLRLYWVITFIGVVLLMDLHAHIMGNLQLYVSASVIQSWFFGVTVFYFLVTCYLIVRTVRCSDLFDDMEDFEGFGLEQIAGVVDSLSADKSDIALFKLLDEKVRSAQLYQNPRFSIYDLSDSIGCPIKDLAQAIVLNTQGDFCRYINNLRIDEVCKRYKLQSCHRGQLLNLAYDCGFSSNKVFNRYFKKRTGCSPSAYVNQLTPKVIRQVPVSRAG